MKRRSPLIGFTEAELGFVVAAVVALAAMTAPGSGTGEADTAVGADSAAADSASSDASRVDSLDLGLLLTPSSGDSGGGGPRNDTLSNVILKRCYEVGLPRSPIPPIDVLGAEWFAVGPDSGGFEMLERIVAPHEARARSRPCRFILYFRSHGLTTDKEWNAVWRRFAGRFERVAMED